MKERINVIHDDCIAAMKKMIKDSVSFDSAVCDPPYHLASIVKRFGKEKLHSQMGGKGKKQPENRSAQYKRLSRGFMGKEWDGGDIAFDPKTWGLVFELLKPGSHLVAFSATRNYHRMAVAIEDAGFEIRDQLAWIYGTGFPKSHDVEKSTKLEEWRGWGSALKPAWEPIVLARKPLEGTIASNVIKHHTGALNIDGCRIKEPGKKRNYGVSGDEGNPHKTVYSDRKRIAYDMPEEGRFPANIIHDGSREFSDMLPGGAARFFYSAKADKGEKIDRDDSHPTVKPVDLMSWLCRLVTPPGGSIIDPFAGTGSTGIGGALEGFSVTLIERDKGYYQDILERIAKGSGTDTPLFNGILDQVAMF